MVKVNSALLLSGDEHDAKSRFVVHHFDGFKKPAATVRLWLREKLRRLRIDLLGMRSLQE
jgi:hypothetical protein